MDNARGQIRPINPLSGSTVSVSVETSGEPSSSARGSEGQPAYLNVIPVGAWVNGEEVTGWSWVSFTDPDRPKGTQFLGVVVTETARVPMLGLFDLNPGGEMAWVEIPPEHVPPPEYRNRLLDRDEAERAGEF